MLPNFDKDTGIHYGVIHQNGVLQAWADSSQTIYPDLTQNADWAPDEPIGFNYNKEGYQAFNNADDPYIMVIKSPYYTYTKPCSPCFPNAGNLDSPTNNFAGYFRTYCFGDDWFDGGKAPYPVFKVQEAK